VRAAPQQIVERLRAVAHEDDLVREPVFVQRA
jgi:hypothetical protein